MPPATKPPFAKCLLASGLMTPADWERHVHTLPPLPPESPPLPDEALADSLVAAQVLTQFQAQQLLAGHTKLTLGPYVIVDSLGQGGMGQVFLAKHQMLGRLVAVKVLPRSKTTPESIASFMREIRVQALLDHEHLVKAIDAGHDGNVYYLVCEYVPGSDLRRYVREKGAIGMAEAASIMTQAARGLEYAHNQGLIHRDVKPGNLLVTPEGHCKVSDLGLAGWLHDGDDPRAGKIVGTADYLSPEQILTPLAVTTKSDIYSLGCTLYYAVTGKVPYPGGTTRDKAKRHCEDAPIHPRVLNPSLSDRFVVLMSAMMAKDPKQRIGSMGELIERLTPWASENGGEGVPQTAAWRVKFDEDPANVLDGNQDTEPGAVDVDPSLSSPRNLQIRKPASGIWTIPDEPLDDLGSGSQSMMNLGPLKPVSNNQWMIPVLLGVVALLAVGLVVMILIQAASLSR
ncbi:MAG: serine/threonine-protein kinase [Pirellulales bacterium]|nr:serine/threonine-protein kinase [Pirellulales bacterium]